MTYARQSLISLEDTPYQRIRELKGSASRGERAAVGSKLALRTFLGSEADRSKLPYRLADYLELVDWTGRKLRSDKRGAIDNRLPPIMQRLSIDADAWRLAMRPRGNVFGRAMGRLNHLRLHANTLGQAWVRGLQVAAKLYTHEINARCGPTPMQPRVSRRSLFAAWRTGASHPMP